MFMNSQSAPIATRGGGALGALCSSWDDTCPVPREGRQTRSVDLLHPHPAGAPCRGPQPSAAPPRARPRHRQACAGPWPRRCPCGAMAEAPPLPFYLCRAWDGRGAAGRGFLLARERAGHHGRPLPLHYRAPPLQPLSSPVASPRDVLTSPLCSPSLPKPKSPLPSPAVARHDRHRRRNELAAEHPSPVTPSPRQPP